MRSKIYFSLLLGVTLLLFSLGPLVLNAQDTPVMDHIQIDSLNHPVQMDSMAGAQQTTKTDTEKGLSPPSVTDIVSVSKIIWTLIFLLVGYFLIRLFIALFNRFTIRFPRYEFRIKRIIPIFRIFAWVFILYLIIVGIYNPPASTLLAFFASVGVAVGFAAQDLLKNIFGGLVVMFDRPFQIGDKIEAGKYYGEVIEIGIRSTKIVTPDDSIVTVPNCEFMTQYVSNANSGANHCQVVAEIYLPLHVDTERVRQIATEAAQVSKYIFLNKPVVVLFFNEIYDRRTVLKMRLKAYVSKLDKEFAFKSEMTEIVIKSLLDEGIIKEDFYREVISGSKQIITKA